MEKGILAKFDSVASSFSREDRIAVLHDLDCDGICSGALAFNAVKKIRGKEPDIVITQKRKFPEIFPETLKLLEKERINKLICVDMAIDQFPESLAKAESFLGQILLIDHHSDYKFSGKKTLAVKPQFISEVEPSRYPASKLVFDLFSRVTDMDDFSWTASAGLIGDNQLKEWKNFVEKSASTHNSSIKEFERIRDMISAAEVLCPGKLNQLLLLIANSKGPKQVLSSCFPKYVRELDFMIEKIMGEFHARKEIFDELELVWFEFKAKPPVKSAVINRVSNRIFPNQTVIFLQDRGDGFFHVSARRQDFRVKMNELLENAVEGLPEAGGGGHVPAAAAKIRKKDLAEFKRRILESLSK